MRIFKYPIKITDQQIVTMPKGAKILSIQMQQDNCYCYLWALVDETLPNESRCIAIYGTGNPLPDEPGDYITTVQGGGLVWHAFELRSKM